MIKILLVEDHKLMRVGLRSLFEETGAAKSTISYLPQGQLSNYCR